GHGFTGANVEGEIANRRLPPSVEPKCYGKIANRKHGRCHCGQPSPRSLGSTASRKPSPKRLSEKTTTRMANPGARASQALSRMFSNPSRIIPPHVAVRRLTPKPPHPPPPSVR